MLKQKKLIVSACVLLLISISGFSFFQHLKGEEYEKLKLTFVEVTTGYEVGSELNGIDFIQSSSTSDIDIPNITSDKVGKQSFLYIVYGRYGVTREYGLVLQFVDKKEILLELTTKEITLQEGASFNYNDYIKTAKVDEEEVEVDVNIPKDIKKVGTHEVVYFITLDSEKTKKETLIVTVEKKQDKVKETDTQPQTTEGVQQQQNNHTTEQETPVQPQPTPQPSTQPAQFFSSSEYGGIDGAMNACYSVMNTYGGSCTPAERNSDGSWPGYQYTP